jgi:hypothetical protein
LHVKIKVTVHSYIYKIEVGSCSLLFMVFRGSVSNHSVTMVRYLDWVLEKLIPWNLSSNNLVKSQSWSKVEWYYRTYPVILVCECRVLAVCCMWLRVSYYAASCSFVLWVIANSGFSSGTLWPFVSKPCCWYVCIYNASQQFILWSFTHYLSSYILSCICPYSCLLLRICTANDDLWLLSYLWPTL